MKHLNLVYRLVTIHVLIAAATVSSQVANEIKGNDECVEWVSPSTHTWDDIANNNKEAVGFSLCKSGDDVGVVDDENKNCAFISHFENTTLKDYEVAKLRPGLCMYFWKQISFDVNPLNSQALIIGEIENDKPQLTHSHLSICQLENESGGMDLGIMHLSGPLMGHCAVQVSNASRSSREVTIGGGYQGLSAWPLSSSSSSSSSNEEHEEIYKSIEERVNLYFTQEDKNLISSITSHPFDDLMRRLSDRTQIGTHSLRNVLSLTPFVPSKMNEYGLSLLRFVLSERMVNARRRLHNLHLHADTEEWEINGVLLKDFDYYSDPANEEKLLSLLRMCGAIQNASDVPKSEWAQVEVVSYGEDPQLQPHIDTFHSVVKMWVYEKGVVTIDHGPLHFMRGSAHNTKAKLKWIYSITRPPALEAIKESSLRYKGNASNDGMSDILRPVLPLNSFQRTLIIADTSGIHHRGFAAPGTVRRTYRVQSGLDGGLRRENPFEWEGWRNPLSDEDDPMVNIKSPNNQLSSLHSEL